MSATTPSRWFAPSQWSLRTKLVVSLVVLMTVTVVMIGVVALVSINRYLVGQLDSELISATHRSEIAIRRDPNRLEPERAYPGPAFLVAPGQAAGTLGAVSVDGQIVRAAALSESGQPEAVTIAADSELASVTPSTNPQTVTVDGLGRYRVIATAGPDNATVITGLPMSPVTSLTTRMSIIIGVVALAGLIAAAGGAALIIRQALSPLRRLAQTATQVAATPLDSGEVALSARVPTSDTNPRTEVGRVGAAINHMLEHVSTALNARHQSETRLRNFLADASHELRTPLASIRGYAELTHRADRELPNVVVQSLHRIESESIRMTGLVEDMLLLARLDAGRPLAREPVDLSELLVAAASDAHVAGPDHNWTLDLPERPIAIAGDGERLHQVLSNLLSNARIHTPAGTTVKLSMQPTVDHVIIEVTDNGPGIPPDLMPEIFERFSRADTSRSRQAGGSGLGLAIAAAIVAAHHGTTTVRSRPGDTTFTVTLPAR